jgi:hypothetical protein
MFSSRYHDLFNYSQVKAEFRAGSLAARPYLSLRFSGDWKHHTGGKAPLFLSENALTAAAGVRLPVGSRTTLWAEAGQMLSLLDARPASVPRSGPDYRGGMSWFTHRGATLGERRAGGVLEVNFDAVHVSRFDRNTIGYFQARPGYRLPALGSLQMQVFWNVNLTADAKRLYWANLAETGPGLRVRVPGLSPPVDLSVSFLRGVHLVNRFNPQSPNYWDLRMSLWYAASF